MLTTKESAVILNKLKQIVMLGRQSGFFLILACMSELGYSMMFGEVDKNFFMKRIKGRGYVDTGGSVISEFYTPLVPKGYDFLESIKQVAQSKEK